MPVTRIKNNQITDLTVNAAAKLQDYTVTATKIANNLTYGSDLTITGNLTVQGNTTTIDTVNVVVEDPLILLAAAQTGSPTLDIGFIGKRGTSDNIAMVWDEAQDKFVAVYTSSEVTNTTITINSYASFKSLDNDVTGNLVVTGTSDFNANVTMANIQFDSGAVINAGNNKISNVAEPSANNDVATKFYVDSQAASGFTIEDDAANTTTVSGGDTLELFGTANNISVLITAPDQVTFALTNDVTVTGNVSANIINSTTSINGATGSFSGNVIAANLNANTNVTGVNITASGNVSAANVDASTAVNTDLIAGNNIVITGTSVDMQLSGNLTMSSRFINDLADPVQAYDAATKQYVDDAVSTGITIHTPVYVETPTALAATYAQGGNTATVTDTVAGNTVVFSAAINPQVNDQLWFTSSFNGIVANVAYFVVSAPNTSAAVLSTTYNGSPVANISNATGLTQAVRINSGVGATLTGNVNGALTVDGINPTAGQRVLVYNQTPGYENGVYEVTDAGNVSAPFILTRSSDTNTYAPESINNLDAGDYFFVQAGNTGAGESYVMTAPIGPFIIGYDSLTFTQFSASSTYSANTAAGLVLNGTIFSAKVDNDTTAFDNGGNISVKAGANLVTPNIGAATGTSLDLTGNVLAANINANTNVTGTTITATGNLVGNNAVITNNISANTGTFTGNVSAANFIGNISGNIDAGGANTQIQFNDGDLLNGSAAFTFDKTSNLVTASGNIDAGNFTTTGQGTFGNIVATGDTINGTNGIVNINGAGADTDFAVNGDTNANVLFVDAGTETVSIGSSTQTTGAALAINTTNSILVPVGNTAQRPTGVTGMVRFNTTTNYLEFYDNNSWETAGSTFTVIANDTFNGDGSTVAFTLSQSATTASVIVSINGVVQLPTTAYGVTGTTLTFTEAPVTGDVIDVRILTTTTTVTSLSGTGGGLIEGSASTAGFDVTGNLLPSANVTYDLGSSSYYWRDLYLSGGTIRLGNIQLKAVNGALSVTTAANVPTSIDTPTIQNGNSNVSVTANGNVNVSVTGTANVLTVTATGANVAGTLNATGNVTGNYFFGNGSQLTGIDATSIQNGTSNVKTILNGNVTISSAGTSNVVVVTSTGANVAGTMNVTGDSTLSGITVSGNTISSAGTTMTIDPSAPGVTGLVVIAGNLQVDGTTTTIDSTTVTINDLVFTTANNAANSSQANGGGIEVGPAGSAYATWTYDQPNSRWSTALGIIASGNITGNYIFGNGSQLTGIDATSIQSGTSNVRVQSSGGNVSVGVGGSAIVRFTTAGIVNDMGNGTGNIGNSTGYFNTIFAKATSAQYADLAEMYEADGVIEPGTVVEFGGSREVTTCGADGSRRVAGVVSTNPSYIMNAGLAGDNVVAVALTGRVPTKVTGTVRKGDLMVAAGGGRARAEANPAVGAVIGKALADFDGAEGVIEVVVGRL